MTTLQKSETDSDPMHRVATSGGLLARLAESTSLMDQAELIEKFVLDAHPFDVVFLAFPEETIVDPTLRQPLWREHGRLRLNRSNYRRLSRLLWEGDEPATGSLVASVLCASDALTVSLGGGESPVLIAGYAERTAAVPDGWRRGITTNDENDLRALLLPDDDSALRLHGVFVRTAEAHKQLMRREIEEARTRQLDNVIGLAENASYLSHEIGNLGMPIDAGLQGALEAVELCRREIASKAEPGLAQRLDAAAMRIRAGLAARAKLRDVAASLSSLRLRGNKGPTRILVADEIEQARNVVRHRLSDTGIHMTIAVGGPLAIQASPTRLALALWNLLLNAVTAIGKAKEVDAERGRIELQAELREDWVRIRIRDDGCGIAADDLERIWDPFFTTRADGSGLGLDLTRKKIEGELRGSIEVATSSPEGTEFVIEIPAYQPAPGEPHVAT